MKTSDSLSERLSHSSNQFIQNKKANLGMKGLLDVASVLLCLKLFLLVKKNTKSLAILSLKCKSLNITVLFIELLYESLRLNRIMLIYTHCLLFNCFTIC